MKGIAPPRYLRLALCATLLALSGSINASEDGNGRLAAPYAYQASDQTVRTVLDRFAADHGLALHIDAASKGRWQTATLDGWVRAPTGRAFLEQLAHAYHFSWFVANRTLHVGGAGDSAVERIALSGTRADSARAALETVGIYDPRFGWGELTGQDAVLVGGPRAYRALVRRLLAGQTQSGDTRQRPEPMVFPLRFTQAGDTPPALGAAAPARPGIATLLRQLLVRESAAEHPLFALPGQTEFSPVLPGTSPFASTAPLAQWVGHPALPPAPSALRPRAAVAALPPASEAASIGIVADDRTNSVIVWGDRGWQASIQRLVDALDRPAPLVSMDIVVIESDLPTIEALSSAGENFHAIGSASAPSAFDEGIAQAVADRRARLLNRQTLVGRINTHTTLAIGGETSHAGTAPATSESTQANGRSGHRGDRLDLAARIVSTTKPGATAIAVDIDLLMAQPTGMPGQTWSNTSSVKLDTTVTLESGAPPRLVASFPVASARAEQRAIFIRAKAL